MVIINRINLTGEGIIKKIIHFVIIILLMIQLSFFSEVAKSLEEMNSLTPEEWNRQFDKVDEQLANKDIDNKTRARLLFERAKLQLVVGPRTPTVWVIGAVRNDPDNPEYRDYLKELYDIYWKDLDIDKTDIRYKDFNTIKRTVERILNIQ